MNNLWIVIKDGLKAFLFWLIASFLMIHFWGDVGKMLSYGLGFIFIVAFCALWAAKLLAWFLSLGNRPAQPPAGWSPPASTPPVQPTYCPKCGAAWVAGAAKCSSCN